MNQAFQPNLPLWLQRFAAILAAYVVKLFPHGNAADLDLADFNDPQGPSCSTHVSISVSRRNGNTVGLMVRHRSRHTVLSQIATIIAYLSYYVLQMTEEEIGRIEVGGKIDPKPPYKGSEEVYEVKMPHAGIKGRIIKYSDTEWAFATGLSLEALSTGPGRFTSMEETLVGFRQYCRRLYLRDLPKGNA